MKTIVFELQLRNWEHVDCNRGFLQNLVSVSKNPIYFVGDKNHMDNILDVPREAEAGCDRGKLAEVHYIPAVILDYNSALELKNAAYYYDIISRTLMSLHVEKEDKIFFLSSPNCVLANLPELHITADIFLMLHAELDNMLDTGCGLDHIIEKRQLVQNVGKFHNVYFMSYNPYAVKALEGFGGSGLYNKCLFINHETWNGKEEPSHPNDTIQTIGIYGNAAFRGCGALFREIEKKGLPEHCRFLILRRPGNLEQLDCSYRYPAKGVELHQKVGGFSRKEMERYHDEMKWILLPYAKDEYRFSASGLLMDAIRLRIPIIALDFPIVHYYNSKGEIGIVADTMEELAERVANEVAAPCEDGNGQLVYEKYCDNMNRLHEMMWNENLEIMRKIYHE